MKLNSKLIGGLALCGAAGIAYGTLGFSEVPGQEFGSAFFPRILAIAIALTGLVFLLSCETAGGTAVKSPARSLDLISLLRQLAIPFAGIVWLLFVESFGFILTTFAILLALMLIARGKLFASLSVATVLTIILYVVFGQLLRVPLPFGLIEQVLR